MNEVAHFFGGDSETSYRVYFLVDLNLKDLLWLSSRGKRKQKM